MARLLLCVGRVAALSVGAAVLLARILLLLLGLLLLLVLLLRLRPRGHDAVVMLRMLKIILRHHTVARRVGVTRELKILFVHVRRRAADFYLGARRIERAVRIVSATTTAAAIVATACVLRPAAASA